MKILRGIAFAIITYLVYLGIPLLGWGLLDMNSFFSIAPRAGYALMVGIFGLLVGYQAIETPEGIRGVRGDDSKRIRRQSVVNILVIFLLYVLLFFLPYADRREIAVMKIGLITRWVGLLITALGFILIFWSGMALGKMYSKQVTIQENHHLVTTGLFRAIRHPRYLGAISMNVGASLLFRSWLALLVSVPLLGLLLIRIKDEEEVLRKEFKEEWDAYCRRSWKLIPYIY